MTKEELLKPRYKVITDYPNSPFTIGDVIRKVDERWEIKRKDGISSYRDRQFENYPAIFSKLEWWEDRAKNNLDMTDYVKCIKSPDNVHVAGRIYKAKWNSVWGYDTETEQPIVVSTNCYEPATKEEYENQNQNQ